MEEDLVVPCRRRLGRRRWAAARAERLGRWLKSGGSRLERAASPFVARWPSLEKGLGRLRAARVWVARYSSAGARGS